MKTNLHCIEKSLFKGCTFHLLHFNNCWIATIKRGGEEKAQGKDSLFLQAIVYCNTSLYQGYSATTRSQQTFEEKRETNDIEWLKGKSVECRGNQHTIICTVKDSNGKEWINTNETLLGALQRAYQASQIDSTVIT